jgi:hypothetical protein
MGIQQKVLAHMQAAERGFRQLEAALERGGWEALTQILPSLKLIQRALSDENEGHVCGAVCSILGET